MLCYCYFSVLNQIKCLFQNELELTRGEKRRAQEKIKILEEEHKFQTELLKREVEKKAKVYFC